MISSGGQGFKMAMCLIHSFSRKPKGVQVFSRVVYAPERILAVGLFCRGWDELCFALGQRLRNVLGREKIQVVFDLFLSV